jgi:hypothetical protein
METMPEGAPASNGSSSYDRGPPPEEGERNNETQRSEANIARTVSLGGGVAGGGTRRNPKGGGRPSIGLEKFVRANGGGKLNNNVKVTYICCKGEGERSFNTTRAKDRFLACRVFQSTFPAEKLGLLGKTSTISPCKPGRSRPPRETTRLVLPLGGSERPSMVTTTASHRTQAEQTDNYFSVIKSDKKAKMDYELANALIKGWHPLFWLAVLYIVVRLTLADSKAVLLAYYASLRLFCCSYFTYILRSAVAQPNLLARWSRPLMSGLPRRRRGCG